MRILLIQPEYQVYDFGFRLAAMTEPLALEILAGCVPEHETRILDMRIESNLLSVLDDFRPDMVGITALTTEVYTAKDVLLAIKEYSWDIFTVAGGHHATLVPEDFYSPYIDAVCLGEGEVVFPQLVEAVENGKPLKDVKNLAWRQDDHSFLRNEREYPDLDMDGVPMPRRDLVEKYREDYFFLFDKPDYTLAASRGCPFRCNFCSVHEFFGGKVRMMSAGRVIDEIRQIEGDHVTFMDDNFLMNHKRENEIADIILSEGIQKSYSMECRTDSIVRHPELVKKWVDCGLYAVLLGLEGADDKVLGNVNKSNKLSVNNEAIEILKANGVIIWGAFLVDPMWDVEDFKKLSAYVREKEITHTQFTILTPLVGTELFRSRYNDLLTMDYTCFDTLHSVLPTKLPRIEFYKRYAELYSQTDIGPYYDLVREGKLTTEDCRRGKQMLDAMSHWEYYISHDPVLRNAPPAH